MSKLKNHTITQLVTFVLISAIALPVLVKTLHGFQNHKHEACKENIATHFHELNLDCEFHKFKLNSNLYFSPLFEDDFINKSVSSLDLEYYSHLSSYDELTSYLRGPPSIV